MQTLPANLLNGNNPDVLTFLQGQSCQSDNLESLRKVLSRFPDARWYCPESRKYRYFLWYRGDTIFAYGVGMRNVSLRIGPEQALLAASQARGYCRFDGNDWYALPYDCEQLEFLARQAYDEAAEP